MYTFLWDTRYDYHFTDHQPPPLTTSNSNITRKNGSRIIRVRVRVKSVVARRICTSANPIKLIYLIDIRRKNDQLSKLELLGNPTMNLADREATPVG